MELIRAGDELLSLNDMAQQLVGKYGEFRYALDIIPTDRPEQENQIYEVKSSLNTLVSVFQDVDQMVEDVYDKFFRDVTPQSYRLYGDLMAEELTGRVSDLTDRFLRAKEHLVSDMNILGSLMRTDDDKRQVTNVLAMTDRFGAEYDLLLTLKALDPVVADIGNSIFADE